MSCLVMFYHALSCFAVTCRALPPILRQSRTYLVCVDVLQSHLVCWVKPTRLLQPPAHPTSSVYHASDAMPRNMPPSLALASTTQCKPWYRVLFVWVQMAQGVCATLSNPVVMSSCAPLTTCTSDEYVALARTPTSNRVCAGCDVCPSNKTTVSCNSLHLQVFHITSYHFVSRRAMSYFAVPSFNNVSLRPIQCARTVTNAHLANTSAYLARTPLILCVRTVAVAPWGSMPRDLASASKTSCVLIAPRARLASSPR
jgi:hypothetical protein